MLTWLHNLFEERRDMWPHHWIISSRPFDLSSRLQKKIM